MNALITKVESLPQKDFLKLINDYDDVYYNNSKKLKPISDSTYDAIRDIYITRFGKLDKVGIRGDRKEVELEYYMGSLDKRKTQKEISNWLNKMKGPILIDDKVDGISCLYINDGKNVYLRKRGDGWNGSDITYLVPHLKLPKIKTKLDVRLELVITKSVFESKYKNKYANARAMVAGITNSKHYIPSEINDITCIAYQLYSKGKQLPKSVQLSKLLEYKFNIACDDPVAINKSDIDLEFLQEYLKERETDGDYIIDGLVLTDDNPYALNVDENPKYSIAFKGLTQSAITTVTGIEWNPSKDGYLKPTVLFKPVVVSEANLSRATGFNAEFIKNNGVGIGAQIEIIRSGGVIAYIKEVIKGVEPLMPTDKYKWEGCEIILLNKDDSRVDLKNIEFFFKTMDVKYLSSKTLEKIYNAGFDSISKIIKAKPSDFSNIERMGEKTSIKICNNIKTAITNCELATVMCASGCFGRGLGVKKLQKLITTNKDILTWNINSPTKINKVKNILQENSIDKLSDNFITGFPEFKKFLKTNSLITIKQEEDEEEEEETEDNTENETSNEGNPKGFNKNLSGSPSHSDFNKKYFNNKVVIFSGVRDKILEAKIIKCGGKVVTSMSKKVNLLIVKETGKYTGKELEAQKNNIPIALITDITL
jgi:DNA ligase (NAD+)